LKKRRNRLQVQDKRRLPPHCRGSQISPFVVTFVPVFVKCGTQHTCHYSDQTTARQ